VKPQWDVGAISQRYVAAWCASSAVSEGIAQRGLRTGLRTHPGERVSSIRDSLPQAAGPPRPRSVRGRQLLTEGVVQFAAADLALEYLVTAVVVLPLLGVDEAGPPLRREELNAR
jgi:hypothetical protein